MARIQPLEPPYPDDVQQSFDKVMRGKEPLLLFRTLAASPRAWEKFRAGSLLDRGPLTLRDREIVIDRTTGLAGCEYEWGVHVAVFAEHAGLTDEQIRATCNARPDASCWSDAERALIAAVDALHCCFADFTGPFPISRTRWICRSSPKAPAFPQRMVRVPRETEQADVREGQHGQEKYAIAWQKGPGIGDRTAGHGDTGSGVSPRDVAGGVGIEPRSTEIPAAAGGVRRDLANLAQHAPEGIARRASGRTHP